MHKIKTLVEYRERLDRENSFVIMRLENSSKMLQRERAIEFFQEKLEIQIEDKVKWVKEMRFCQKVILISLKAWEGEQEVMGRRVAKFI